MGDYWRDVDALIDSPTMCIVRMRDAIAGLRAFRHGCRARGLVCASPARSYETPTYTFRPNVLHSPPRQRSIYSNPQQLL